jgi:hypothetical protein
LLMVGSFRSKRESWLERVQSLHDAISN